MNIVSDKITNTQYAVSAQTFLTEAVANADALGLSDAELDDLEDGLEAYTSALERVNALKAALEAAVVAKEERRKELKERISRINAAVRQRESVDDALLTLLMLAPKRSVRTDRAVVPVQNLVVSANDVGEVLVKWDRAGNAPRTTFWVEEAASSSGPWQVVETTSATRVRLLRRPGVPAWYRIRAKRSRQGSAPCPAVPVWSGAPPGALAA